MPHTLLSLSTKKENKMKMKEIVVSEFHSCKGKYGFASPYAIAFVYHPDGNCVVKGMCDEVETYILQNFPQCFYNMTFWKDGKCRNLWRSPLKLYFTRKKIDGRRKFSVSMKTKKGKYIDLVTSFRRIPKKWLDIYNQATVKRKRY